MALMGRWRIVDMEMWDQDAADLTGPAFIQFDESGAGRFRFVAVEGILDCELERRDGRPRVEFTWKGTDEGDHVHGRGWAELGEDGTLGGRIRFHLGDSSAFQAVPARDG